jgi:hypothetical protein
MKPYTPSDGFQADYTLSNLKVRNVLYITQRASRFVMSMELPDR